MGSTIAASCDCRGERCDPITGRDTTAHGMEQRGRERVGRIDAAHLSETATDGAIPSGPRGFSSEIYDIADKDKRFIAPSEAWERGIPVSG